MEYEDYLFLLSAGRDSTIIITGIFSFFGDGNFQDSAISLPVVLFNIQRVSLSCVVNAILFLLSLISCENKEILQNKKGNTNKDFIY